MWVTLILLINGALNKYENKVSKNVNYLLHS